MAINAQSFIGGGPGFVNPGGSDSGISSFTERLQRKQEIKDRQKIIRERQLEVDAENLSRYNERMALAANESKYQHGREAIQDAQNAGRYKYFETDQKNKADDRVVEVAKRDRDELTDKNAFDVQNNLSDTMKSVNTETMDALQNKAEKVMRVGTDAEIKDFGDKTNEALRTGAINDQEITNEAQYTQRLKEKLIEQNATPRQIDDILATAIKGANKTDAVTAQKLKDSSSALEKAFNVQVAENKTRDRPGEVSTTDLNTTSTGEDIDNPWHNAFKGISTANDGQFAGFNAGTRIGNKEIDRAKGEFSRLQIPTDYQLNPKTNKLEATSTRNPTAKEVDQGFKESVDEGYFSADTYAADAIWDSIKRQVRTNGRSKTKESTAKMVDRYTKRQNELIDKTARTSGESKVKAALGQ